MTTPYTILLRCCTTVLLYYYTTVLLYYHTIAWYGSRSSMRPAMEAGLKRLPDPEAKGRED